ncbi:cytochrome P450 [Sulfitobacter pseudonitzschiae]|uniref:Cytochrome P450 n=1 Tax=Pseudosulfitobacter pseudonitzschiae TaxID=1402135 RepID=A0A9Q2RYT0_9RHOB|nr:cytochrome P450 [Pseudosulfitobacter pseudonitzschiae]MBM2293944.1 cytochrome P450 [Pseudosulfitobacter pseudonitzschiae]MBM2298909.1 cytochrome P450 [Pseudosulfitobacter pseudonitzschiae]MBM2303823.1 cytochrome P450 [Pseudosulfitobacter pseudonitzschiae]MBM2313558.1 cytochrome P450 [Pseudosulfitobacter pseudonitzschiae]MBM2318520.1 cytochrome P450 [Pseudosulfitobacter pseudonitzschiae]
MTTLAPLDETITLDQLDRDPYPIYRRLRAEAPVLRVKAAGRTLLTKAEDTKYVKDTPEIFSSDDPNTPMKRAFQAHTLMRKDGEAHKRERMAMAPAFAPKVIMNDWMPRYQQIAEEYVARLPRGEVVDLFPALSGPYAARGLAVLLGLDEATDDQMQHWSQALINGAGNFGWKDEPFAISDQANTEMNALMDSLQDRHRADPNNSALSVMLNADDPIEMSQIYSNIKIAIGGGINEPRDALNTIIYGLLTNPDQMEEVKRNADWDKSFEEGVRWVAPIQASARLVLEDTEIRGYHIPKGDTVMTIQASACRDEDLYENGEDFIVYRDKNQHQAFGNGPHFCQGTHVARRAVGQVMLPLLFDRFPNMSIPDTDDVIWRGFGFRGPVQIPVLLN